MTLILSRNSGKYILQVSDRLITRSGDPVDQASNKTIIYHARDAIVTMSYTGLAYISNIPTDQWIAEMLIGLPYDRNRKPPAIGPGTRKYTDIGLSLRIIKDRLESISQTRSEDAKIWNKTAFDLSINGWQWDKKGHSRPLVAWLSKGADDKSIEIGHKNRDWFYGGRMIVTAAPAGYVKTNQLREITDALSYKSPDDSVLYLTRVIQSCSKVFPQIGSDCMSVLLLHPNNGLIRVKYIPDQINKALMISDQGSSIIKVGFTPWMIGPNVTYAPALLFGQGWQFSLGYFSVEIDAPTNPTNFGVLSSQDRQM